MSLKTKDGLDYVEGMPIYFWYHNDVGWHLSEASETKEEDGKIWFKATNQEYGSLGDGQHYYGDRNKCMFDMLLAMIEDMETQLAGFFEGVKQCLNVLR